MEKILFKINCHTIQRELQLKPLPIIKAFNSIWELNLPYKK